MLIKLWYLDCIVSLVLIRSMVLIRVRNETKPIINRDSSAVGAAVHMVHSILSSKTPLI